MKVLVVGGGGREHALVAALALSSSVSGLYCAPGNAGMEAQATCLPELLASDIDGLAAFAVQEAIDLTVVGPEAPLVAGIADVFAARDLLLFGPNRSAARLEGSKSFAKAFMTRHRIPTAHHRSFDDLEAARSHVQSFETYPLVVKADGLAAGKGVTICPNVEAALEALSEAMEARRFGEAGRTVVIEEYLAGEEASIHAITDGTTILLLPTSQDHKAIGDGDTGPNTGGMGAYSPAPIVEGSNQDRIVRTILLPLLHALRSEGIDYRGVLYVGLMMTPGGPRVLEFNTRFGDPEAEVILPRLGGDLAHLLVAAARGTLGDVEPPEVDPRPSVGVVLASKGYPGPYPVGKRIEGLESAAALSDVSIFHAGTRSRPEGIVTAGGRVLCVCALGADVGAAKARAYEAVEAISFEGMTYRRDIGYRALGRRRASRSESAGPSAGG